jgi:Na+/H+ antiporter
LREIESLILLLGAAALLAQLARTLAVPYPVFLVVGGLVIGFVPGLPTLRIPPEVIFTVFLPPLLNYAAFFTSPRDLRAHLRPIALLAVGLVLFTMSAVALVAHFLIGMPWAVAFVLGAILGPTDPTAAQAVFGRLGVPARVRTIVEGESLVNDGSGLVAYRIAVAAVVGGAFSLWEAGLDFVVMSGGGLLFGVVLGWAVLPLWARVKDSSIFIALSLLTAYAVYILAEDVLHVSGVLAVVSYGLYRGWRDPRIFPDASTRARNISFWGVLIFLLESLLFVLIGQQLPSVIAGLGEYRAADVLLYGVLIYAALTAARFGWFFIVPSLNPVFDRVLRTRYFQSPWQQRLLMSWSGMRGAVALAAALAIPVSTSDGSPFPERDLVLFLTFSAILASLVLQGLTLGPLTRALRLKGEEGADKLVELETRLEASRAALERLEQLGDDERISSSARERVREQYEERIRRYRAGIEAGGTTEEYAQSSSAWRAWRRELIEAEREAVLRKRDQAEIGPEVMRRVLRDIDLEELRVDDR